MDLITLETIMKFIKVDIEMIMGPPIDCVACICFLPRLLLHNL